MAHEWRIQCRKKKNVFFLLPLHFFFKSVIFYHSVSQSTLSWTTYHGILILLVISNVFWTGTGQTETIKFRLFLFHFATLRASSHGIIQQANFLQLSSHLLSVATAAEELGHEGPLRVNGEVRGFLPPCLFI